VEPYNGSKKVGKAVVLQKVVTTEASSIKLIRLLSGAPQQ
jgi:hypothetical protein